MKKSKIMLMIALLVGVTSCATEYLTRTEVEVMKSVGKINETSVSDEEFCVTNHGKVYVACHENWYCRSRDIEKILEAR